MTLVQLLNLLHSLQSFVSLSIKSLALFQCCSVTFSCQRISIFFVVILCLHCGLGLPDLQRSILEHKQLLERKVTGHQPSRATGQAETFHGAEPESTAEDKHTESIIFPMCAFQWQHKMGAVISLFPNICVLQPVEIWPVAKPGKVLNKWRSLGCLEALLEYNYSIRAQSTLRHAT